MIPTVACCSSPGPRALFTDFRYQLWAQPEAAAFKIMIYKVSLGETLAELLKELQVQRLGFEAAYLTIGSIGAWLKPSIPLGSEWSGDLWKGWWKSCGR